MLIELIDGSALNTALPQIANDLHVNAITLKVAITVYLLALGLFIPASGWISDKIGSKNLLLLSITGFMFSSIACGLSTNLISLVIFRAIQGAFGAFTAPVVRLAMVRIYKNDVLTAMSIVAVIAALGPMLGPFVWRSDYYSHWLENDFFHQCPNWYDSYNFNLSTSTEYNISYVKKI